MSSTKSITLATEYINRVVNILNNSSTHPLQNASFTNATFTYADNKLYLHFDVNSLVTVPSDDSTFDLPGAMINTDNYVGSLDYPNSIQVGTTEEYTTYIQADKVTYTTAIDNPLYVMTLTIQVDDMLFTQYDAFAQQLYLTSENTGVDSDPTVYKTIQTNTNDILIDIKKYAPKSSDASSFTVAMNQLIVPTNSETENQPVTVYYDSNTVNDKNILVKYGILEMDEIKVKYTTNGVSEFKNALSNDNIDKYINTDNKLAISYDDTAGTITIMSADVSVAPNLVYKAPDSVGLLDHRTGARRRLLAADSLYEESGNITVTDGTLLNTNSVNYLTYNLDSLRINALTKGTSDDVDIDKFNAFDVNRCSNFETYENNQLQLIVVDDLNNILPTSFGAMGTSQWVIKNDTNIIIEGTISGDELVLSEIESGIPAIYDSTANKAYTCEVIKYTNFQLGSTTQTLYATLVSELADQNTVAQVFGSATLYSHVLNVSQNNIKNIATFNGSDSFGGSNETATVKLENTTTNAYEPTISFSNSARSSNVEINNVPATVITNIGDISGESHVLLQTDDSDMFTNTTKFESYLHSNGNSIPVAFMFKVIITKLSSDKSKVEFIKNDSTLGASVIIQNTHTSVSDDLDVNNSQIMHFTQLKYYNNDAVIDTTHETSIIHNTDIADQVSHVKVLLKDASNNTLYLQFSNLKVSEYMTLTELLSNTTYTVNVTESTTLDVVRFSDYYAAEYSEIVTDHNSGGVAYSGTTSSVVVKATITVTVTDDSRSVTLVRLGPNYSAINNDEITVYFVCDFSQVVKDIAVVNTIMLDNTHLINSADITGTPTNITITSNGNSVTFRNVADTHNLSRVRDIILNNSGKFTTMLDEHCNDLNYATTPFNPKYYPYNTTLIATVYSDDDNDEQTPPVALLKIGGRNKVTVSELNVVHLSEKLKYAADFVHNSTSQDMQTMLTLHNLAPTTIQDYVNTVVNKVGELNTNYLLAATQRYNNETQRLLSNTTQQVVDNSSTIETVTNTMKIAAQQNSDAIQANNTALHDAGITTNSTNVTELTTEANNEIATASDLEAKILADVVNISNAMNQPDNNGTVLVQQLNVYHDIAKNMDTLVGKVLYEHSTRTNGPNGNFWKSLEDEKTSLNAFAAEVQAELQTKYTALNDEIDTLNDSIRFTNERAKHIDVALFRVRKALENIQNPQ